VSRHPPLPSQIDALFQKLEELGYKNMEIRVLNDTYKGAIDVYKDLQRVGAKYAVLVLPLSMIERLLGLNETDSAGITFLRAEMEPVHTDSCVGESCELYDPQRDVILKSPEFNRHLRFTEFKRIVEVRVVTEEW